jgi:ribonuclease HI
VEALEREKPLDKWAIDTLHERDNGTALAAAILRGEAKAVSDGSFKNAQGTSASILFHESSKEPNRIVSVNSVPGNWNEQSAYRSELAGISGSLAITAAVCHIHDIQEGSITFGLDGNQALKAAAGDWPLNPERPDFDLITDIRAKLRKLPIQVHWKWVKGHQDDRSDPVLDKWAKANIMADNLAKAYWNHLNRSGHVALPQRFGDEAWAIHFRGKKLNRMDKTAIYKAIMDPTTKDYWRRRGNLHAADIPNIDWDLIGAAFKLLTNAKKRRVTKHAAGHFGCGKMMSLWRFQDHSKCPRCPEPNKDPQHILRCPAPSARA